MTDLFTEQVDQTPDPNMDYLAELVGEGKKFKTVNDLARGKFEADRFIEFKNREFDRLREDFLREREENQTKARLEELIDKMSNRDSSSDNTPANEKDTAFDLKQVENLVTSKLHEHEMTRRQTENINNVMGKLRERYGNSYQDVLKQQMSEMDLSQEEVNTIARDKPKLFFKALGLDQPVRTDSFQAPPRTSTSFVPQAEKKRTWSFYEDLRKKDPRTYLDPKTQIQMQNDIIKLGDEFRDGDYNRM